MDGYEPEATLPGTQVRDPGHDAPGGHDDRQARWTGPAARRIRAHPRLSAAAGLVAAAVVAAAVLFALTPRYHEQVTGPAGPYPAAVTPGGGAARVLATAHGRVLVTGGLAVEVAESGDLVPSPGPVVTALSLRTGRKYWTYRRPGHDVEDMETDGSTVYVLWDDGVLASIDPRTARARWHASVGLRALGGAANLDAPGQGRPVLVIGTAGAEAVSAATGTPAWTVSAPSPAGARKPCQFLAGSPAVTGPVLTLATSVPGPAACAGYYGYSLATGRLRWHYKVPLGPSRAPVVAGDDQVLVSPSDDESAVVLGTATGRPGTSLPIPTAVQSAGDGHMYAVSGTQAWAWSTATGRLTWHIAAPAGLTLVDPRSPAYPALPGSQQAVTSGDRVYVTAESHVPKGTQQWWLLAFDAGDGHLLSKDRLPAQVSRVCSSPVACSPQFLLDPVLTGAWPGGVLTVTGAGKDPRLQDADLPALVVAAG